MMIITGLLDLHSVIRYAIIILLIGSLFAAYRGLLNKNSYTKDIRKWHLSTRLLVNAQMLVGLILYILKSYYEGVINPVLLQGMYGFFAIVHIIGMMVGIALINHGYHRAEDAKTDHAKHRYIAIFYSFGFGIIFLMIPWPFFHTWATWF